MIAVLKRFHEHLMWNCTQKWPYREANEGQDSESSQAWAPVQAGCLGEFQVQRESHAATENISVFSFLPKLSKGISGKNDVQIFKALAICYDLSCHSNKRSLLNRILFIILYSVS